jgi:hypothetical protein
MLKAVPMNSLPVESQAIKKFSREDPKPRLQIPFLTVGVWAERHI